MKLSVGIITFNEEKIIEKTLKSIVTLADEIIIVDSHSTDATREICERYGCRVFTEDWKGFGPQKNSVLEKCSGEWILLIDADEELSKELQERIKEIISGKNEYDVYDINRCSICFGKELKYGGWSNQYATRLWKNGSIRVSDNFVHEEFLGNDKKGKIVERILHHSYLTMEDYFHRFNRYTTLGALDYYKNGKKPSLFGILISPHFKFFRMYIIRLGFLDGVEGFTIALTSAMYTAIKYFKLRELYKNNEAKRSYK